MEIRVNNQARERTANNFVGTTIIMAQDCARRGIDTFVMRYPKGIGYSVWDYVDMVKQATNNTVGLGSWGNGLITFNIQK